MKKKIILKEKHKKSIKFLVTGIILVIVFLLVKELVTNVESITQITKSAGIFGPIILIILMSVGILVTPIPSFILIIAAGYLYGMWFGALYSYLAHLLASSSVFGLVEFFKPELKKTKHAKYKNLINKNKNFLYILYMIPIVPITITSILSASIKIKWKEFLKITLISFLIPVIFFSYFGNKLNSESLIKIGILSGITIIALFFIVKLLNKRITQKYEQKNNKKIKT